MKLFDKKPTYHKVLRDSFNRVFESTEYKKRREDMNRWLKRYRGEWWNPDEMMANPDASKIFVNMVFSTIETSAPLLTDNRPVWHAIAREAKFQGAMERYKLAGDYLWDKLDMDRKIYEVCKDALLWPIGLLKVYWDPEEDEIAVDVEDPRTFAIAPGYEQIKGVAWCGVKKSMPMTWVRSKFPDKISEVKPDGETKDVDWKDGSDIEAEAKTVTVYEIWCKDSSMVKQMIESDDRQEEIEVPEYPNGRVIIMTDTTILSDEPAVYQHGEPPWIPLYDYQVPHEFWGMGEPQQIEDLNKELNLRLQTLVNHAHNVQNPNYMVDIGMDIDDVRETFNKGGQFYLVNNIESEPIRAVRAGQLDQIHGNLIDGIKAMIEEVSGVVDITKGMVSKKSRQSASEIGVLIESAYTRTRQKVRNLEWTIKHAYKLILEIMQQFYTEPRQFTVKKGDQVGTFSFGNSGAQIAQASRPPQEDGETQMDYSQRLSADQGWQEMVATLGSNVDPVYIKFDIQVDTNSTLPLDKQSLANIILRLAEIRTAPDGVVDRKTILETVGIPNAEEIDARMNEQMKQMMAMKQGGPQ